MVRTYLLPYWQNKCDFFRRRDNERIDFNEHEQSDEEQFKILINGIESSSDAN